VDQGVPVENIVFSDEGHGFLEFTAAEGYLLRCLGQKAPRQRAEPSRLSPARVFALCKV
jgi:hypothetical protein